MNFDDFNDKAQIVGMEPLDRSVWLGKLFTDDISLCMAVPVPDECHFSAASLYDKNEQIKKGLKGLNLILKDCEFRVFGVLISKFDICVMIAVQSDKKGTTISRTVIELNEEDEAFLKKILLENVYSHYLQWASETPGEKAVDYDTFVETVYPYMSETPDECSIRRVDEALVRLGVIKPKEVYAHSGSIANIVHNYFDEDGDIAGDLSDFDEAVKKSIPDAIKETEAFFDEILKEIKEEEQGNKGK